MFLAEAMATAEDELICDFAETYRVYDYLALPCATATAFACGLNHESRTMKKLSGIFYSTEEYLLSVIADRLGLLVWMKTKDGEKGRNRPESFVERLTEKHEPKSDIMAFNTKEELDAALRKAEGKI